MNVNLKQKLLAQMFVQTADVPYGARCDCVDRNVQKVNGMPNKFDDAHMKVAETYAKLSSAIRLKVGSIIVKDENYFANNIYPVLKNAYLFNT